ncbi:MAG: type II toxin-antitoxin system VapC family toxin [Pseudomonadales bacterium]
MWVLDTNTLIYFFKGVGRVSETLLSHTPSDIAVPAIVLYELEVGIAKSSSPTKRRQQLQAFVAATQVLAFGVKEAQAAAQIRASLEKSGQPIGAHDVLIAATALAQKATLVTHNTKEFGRIKSLELEDWF